MFLVAKSVGKRVSKKGRVSVVLLSRSQEETKYSLKFEKIKRVLYDGKNYYIDYETENEEYYRSKYLTVDEPPRYALPLKFSTYKREVCRCGSFIEWDADEPYCPRCGYNFEIVSSVKLVHYEYPDEKEFFKLFLEEKMGLKLRFVRDNFCNMAGGTSTTLEKVKRKVNLNYSFLDWTLREVHVGENLVEVTSYWDETEVWEKKTEGKFVIAVVSNWRESGWHYFVYQIL